jgi:UDP-N-acetylmuramoyl-tripeptide--D-alanyl-D-alanine ligase
MAVTALLAFIHLIYEYKRVLMMLQQNSYRNERYMRWLRASGDTTSYIRIFAMMVMLVSLISVIPAKLSIYLILLLSAIGFGKLFTAKYKKPLVFTKRVWRIFSVMLVLTILVLSAIGWFASRVSLEHMLFVEAVGMLVLYVGSHIVVLAANTLLAPVEKAINKKFYNEAAHILSQMPELKIVGITGSYGKTSTKHYLHRILSEKYDVLMTPGSYNTTLGVIRTIREYLKPYNQVFIVEMGASKKAISRRFVIWCILQWVLLLQLVSSTWNRSSQLKMCRAQNLNLLMHCPPTDWLLLMMTLNMWLIVWLIMSSVNVMR